MSTQTYSATQIMMTLSALAGTSSAAAGGPSPESASDQIQRITLGISGYLGQTSLATGGAWKVMWVGLYPQDTPNDNNLVFVAQATSGDVAVVIRGTTNGYEGGEDADDASQVAYSGLDNCGQLLNNGNVSSGMAQAFNNIMSMDLLSALTPLISGKTTIYVTGHSLGGALATMVALYLNAQTWSNATPTIALYTFAAPTAGDATFATAVNALSPQPQCYVNAYDAVPLGYAQMDLLDSLYTDVVYGGKSYTITPDAVVKHYIGKLTPPSGVSYMQPTQQTALNLDPTYFDTSTTSFTTEAIYQHQNNTYLSLLAAPNVPDLAPTISGVSVAGTSVTITVAASSTIVDVAIGTGSTSKPVYVTVTGAAYASPPTTPPTIICQLSSALTGTFYVWVTTEYGSSAAYTYTPPTSAA